MNLPFLLGKSNKKSAEKHCKDRSKEFNEIIMWQRF